MVKSPEGEVMDVAAGELCTEFRLGDVLNIHDDFALDTMKQFFKSYIHLIGLFIWSEDYVVRLVSQFFCLSLLLHNFVVAPLI